MPTFPLRPFPLTSSEFNAGGMGYIGQKDNDYPILSSSLKITLNVAAAARRSGAKVIYASSACVYPKTLQSSGITDPAKVVRLGEDQAYPADPDDVYGWEKLAGEKVLQTALASNPDQLRIVRLFNVYGEGGTWFGGREKAPAAFCRKVAALKMLMENGAPAEDLQLEVWGDGGQYRSFLSIHNCVAALLAVGAYMGRQQIFNIGSDELVTVDQLAMLVMKVAGVDPAAVPLRHSPGPVGVGSRNGDFSRAKQELQWEPTTSLEEGLSRVYMWIQSEIEQAVQKLQPQGSAPSSAASTALLRVYSQSHQCTTAVPQTSFGVLLPITGRGQDPSKFWDRLANFCAHFSASIGSDPLRQSVQILVGLDNDDPIVGVDQLQNRQRLHQMLALACCWQGGTVAFSRRVAGRQAGQKSSTAGEKAKPPSLSTPPSDVHILDVSKCTRGAVCQYWNLLASHAFEQLRCTYVVLLGDDVEMKSPRWMTAVDNEFKALAQRTQLPQGFGCVAIEDGSFPGFPSFPVVSHLHYTMLAGCVLPKAFINQHGDPFLFQLYRRWGANIMAQGPRLLNTVGGPDPARYDKQDVNWTDSVLSTAVTQVTEYLEQQGYGQAQQANRKIVLDIVVPSYRCQLDLLEPMLALKAPSDADLCYIVIGDRPEKEMGQPWQHLEKHYGSNWRYRLRCQDSNTGASAARNRGLRESAADWVLFLDDDVKPSATIVEQYVAAIRAHPEEQGFAGPTYFPELPNVRCLAIRLAGITHFWDRPAWSQRTPWAVTANVLLRRRPDLVFDLQFPKTGGGEDIDACIKMCGNQGLRCVPGATAVHPWWNNGWPAMSRYYGWAMGDGALIHLYPQFTYWLLPNATEAVLLLAAAGSLQPVLALPPALLKVPMATGGWLAMVAPWLPTPRQSLALVTAVLVGDVLHEGWRHLIYDRQQYRMEKGVGSQWHHRLLAVPHAWLARNASELGRAVGHLQRGRPHLLCRRFEWFLGMQDGVVASEWGLAVGRVMWWVGVGLGMKMAKVW